MKKPRTPPPGKIKTRTPEELVAAIVFLEMMEERANVDPDVEARERVGKVANKGIQMLLWALGADNEFGVMVARFVEKATK